MRSRKDLRAPSPNFIFKGFSVARGSEAKVFALTARYQHHYPEEGEWTEWPLGEYITIPRTGGVAVYFTLRNVGAAPGSHTLDINFPYEDVE